MADICELLLVVMFAGLLCRVECVLVCVFWVCFGWRWWFSGLVVFVWRVGQFVTAASVWFSLVVVLLVGLVWCLRCEFPLFVGRVRVGSVGWLAFSGLCGTSFVRYCPVPGNRFLFLWG